MNASWRTPRFFLWCAALLAVSTWSSQLVAQVTAIVDRVSQSNYFEFQQDVESMGLGLYGGPQYNQGIRNRDGWAGAGTLGNQEARLYLQNTYTDMGLNVSTQGSYRNVVAELPGLATPERIFIVGGHYDHIGGDRPGGDDNASGTAGVLEAARVLSQFRFASTIRFIGFNAEEDGLLGSRDYVTSQVVGQGGSVVGMVNLDMILRPAWDSGGAVIDADLETRTSHSGSVVWANAYRQAAAAFAPSLAVSATTYNVNGGSDQDPFAAAGIPAFLVSENTAQEIWGGSNAYYHGFQDASNRLANDPNSPSGVTYDFAFASNIVRVTVGLIAQQAGLLFSQQRCDMDFDADCDLQDLNALLQRGPVAQGVPVHSGATERYDLDQDGTIDNADVDSWLSQAAASEGLGSPYLRGDANLDGTVDGSDSNLWNSGRFTSTLRWDLGDFNGDGNSDGSDFGVWNLNKFTSSDFVSAVPEPGTLFWWFGPILGLRIMRRRDSSRI